MRIQTPFEEKLNAISHGIGVLFGVVALLLMGNNDSGKSFWSFESVILYGLTIIVLFSASTLYHSVSSEKHKHYFRIIDHISIYFLIAGTYTPVCLITLEGSRGWSLFYSVWSIAIIGTVLKLFFTGRFELVSTLLYLVMGWLIVFDFTFLSETLHPNGLLFLFAGGMAYTLGIVFYIIEKIPYNHVIWHLFVLAGAICHFLMVFLYII